MCVTFTPPPPGVLARLTGEDLPELVYTDEAWPGRAVPILLGNVLPDGRFALTSELAVFGLIPHWAKDRNVSHTHNARTETVASKPSFRTPWRKAQFCLVPMASFREPYFGSGKKSAPWRIHRQDQQTFAVAGIWDVWVDPQTGERIRSFSMLTINADGHPIMGQFHREEDEKRSLVIVPPDDWQRWLTATPEVAQSMLKPMPVEEFTSEEQAGVPKPHKAAPAAPSTDQGAPPPKAAKRSGPQKPQQPPEPPPPQGDLF